MNKIALEIIGLSYSHSQSGAYALILGEKNSKRRLPIIIGNPEAQSIALAMEKIDNKRPLTHDLFKAFAETYDINIKEVLITRFMEGIFFSELVTEKDGATKNIDARTSDAVALALRFNCPIYTYPNVLEEAGIIIDDLDTEDDELDDLDEEVHIPENEFDDFSIKDLQEMLEHAIENEEYEVASKIRDEIKRRQF